MRICLVYDCLFPYTVGGAERWYRNLGERLAADGHEVTYLTLRQWPRREKGHVPGVRVVPVGPRLALYASSGRRRILPPLVFGLGVFAHLLWRGGRYDVVHTASFPYFSLLAAARPAPAAALRAGGRLARGLDPRLLDRVPGPRSAAGWAISCSGPASGSPSARSASRASTPRRLARTGLPGQSRSCSRAMYAGPLEARDARRAGAPIVFAGRHIPEKRVPALVPAMAALAARAARTCAA